MAAAKTTITISFKPLLKQICACLGFSEPIYNYLDLFKNISYIVVPTQSEPAAYMFVGGEGGSLEDSAERAAKKLVLFLMKKHNICVEDVNLETRERAERCVELFKFKRKEFECIEKGLPISLSHDIVPAKGVQDSVRRVRVDFLDILRVVVSKLGISVTPVEYVQFGQQEYVAWFTVACPNNSSVVAVECVAGDKSVSVSEAKQSLAKKAILYLMPLYSFQVEDANFHFLQLDTFAFKLERESYLTIKESVYGLKEDSNPRPCLVEQDQLTPRGEEFKIPALHYPPLPPKKRKRGEAARAFSSVVPNVAVPEELTTVFKRKTTK